MGFPWPHPNLLHRINLLLSLYRPLTIWINSLRLLRIFYISIPIPTSITWFLVCYLGLSNIMLSHQEKTYLLLFILWSLTISNSKFSHFDLTYNESTRRLFSAVEPYNPCYIHTLCVVLDIYYHGFSLLPHDWLSFVVTRNTVFVHSRYTWGQHLKICPTAVGLYVILMKSLMKIHTPFQ